MDRVIGGITGLVAFAATAAARVRRAVRGLRDRKMGLREPGAFDGEGGGGNGPAARAAGGSGGGEVDGVDAAVRPPVEDRIGEGEEPWPASRSAPRKRC